MRVLEEAHQIAIYEGLQCVYVGNVPDHYYNSTYCPNCQDMIIKRDHFIVLEQKVTADRCAICDYPLTGVWRST